MLMTMASRRSLSLTSSEAMINKSILKSKTFWVQVATLASVFAPPVQAFLVTNPVEFVALLTAINTVVRFVTSGRIVVLGETPDQG